MKAWQGLLALSFVWNLGWMSQAQAADYAFQDHEGIERMFPAFTGGKPLLVNFIYTNCASVCPTQGRHFKRVQETIRAHYQGPLAFISISIDPERDSAADLKAWREKLGGSSHWTLLRAPREIFEKAALEMMGTVPSPGAHSPFIALRDASGAWHRIFGLTPVSEIAALLNEKGKTSP